MIGDSAVVILRGATERRYEATTPPANLEPEAAKPEAQTAEPNLHSAGRTPTAPSASGANRVCWPGTVIPPTHIPATHIPATDIGGYHYPAIDFPAKTLPGTTLAGGCFEGGSYLAPSQTTVLVSGYEALDPEFSPELSAIAWDSAPVLPDVLAPGFTAASIPDTSAPGYGELNGAGYPKNQYVRSYTRANGSQVGGYWRNSPSDGLPTCQIISCR